MSEERTPRFTGKYSHTKKNIMESTLAAVSGWQRWLICILAGYILILSVVLLFNPTNETPDYIRLGGMIFLSVFLIFYRPLYAWSYTRTTCKRMEEMGTENAEVSLQLYDDVLLGSSSTSEDVSKTTYDHIIRLQETKNLLLLWRPQRLYYPIEKTKLEGGSVDELKAFLKEKNKKIRMR